MLLFSNPIHIINSIIYAKKQVLSNGCPKLLISNKIYLSRVGECLQQE